MLTDFPITILFNGFALALATAFLMIVLWYDIRRTVNQFFAVFLIFVQLWNIGFLISEVSVIATPDPNFNITLFNTGFAISLAGFIGSSISLYALMTIVAGVQPNRFRFLTALYLVGGVGYAIFLGLSAEDFANTLQAQVFAAMFYIGFDALTLYVAWRYRRRFNSITLITGIIVFVIGQGISFLNPNLGIATLSTTFSAIGTLAISFAIVRRELVQPLLERGTQLETMHEVSVAITQQFTTDTVLSEIAQQASDWLQADAAGIFLTQGDVQKLVAIYNLPSHSLGKEISLGVGVAGRVAQENKSIFIENYTRDWHHEDEFDFARDTFGSLICVPLVYAHEVMGVLMVISSTRGTLFEEEDTRLLELLSAQAAVAISHGNLFSDQRRLTTQLSTAHEQLQKVLVSTENPVIAVNRNLNIIFTNPAAETIFELDTFHSRTNLTQALPKYAMPEDYKQALKSIKTKGTFRYEVTVDEKTYFCHVASLGDRQHFDGFVAVLNDVTELKELDRIKSEMVRMTSHDLKNPLQAAFSNLELLRDDIAEIQDAEIQLSVDNIERQLDKMHRIISGILDLERVRIGTHPSEICSPITVLQEATDELLDIAQERDITLELDISPNITDFLGDIDQFKRAIVNLIENAIKFNYEGGTVTIKAHNQDDQIAISISDSGIGIPLDLQPKIFERFYRGHQAGAEHVSGSGLGLSLVKAVIESHNGQIWVQSKPNVGTTFYITVPAIKRSVNAPQ